MKRSVFVLKSLSFLGTIEQRSLTKHSYLLICLDAGRKYCFLHVLTGYIASRRAGKSLAQLSVLIIKKQVSKAGLAKKKENNT